MVYIWVCYDLFLNDNTLSHWLSVYKKHRWEITVEQDIKKEIGQTEFPLGYYELIYLN